VEYRQILRGRRVLARLGIPARGAGAGRGESQPSRRGLGRPVGVSQSLSAPIARPAIIFKRAAGASVPGVDRDSADAAASGREVADLADPVLRGPATCGSLFIGSVRPPRPAAPSFCCSSSFKPQNGQAGTVIHGHVRFFHHPYPTPSNPLTSASTVRARVFS
jgi:hypothetical protein